MVPPANDQLASLEEALLETELQQKALKARIAGLQGEMRNVRVSSGKMPITRNYSRPQSSLSGSSVDESLLDLDRWPIP